MLKHSEPLGITDIQKALGLSSPSVAQYHVRKLLQLGLVKEEQAGYVVDKVVLENVIRIRRVSIPTQTAYVAFFGAAFFILLVFLRPATLTSVYFFAVVVNLAALAVALYETVKTYRRI
jgi:DNA-binding transcriptional ArsR family regulator